MPAAFVVRIGPLQISIILAEVTPTATAAPTARITYAVVKPGALPQALYFCAYSARCLQSSPPAMALMAVIRPMAVVKNKKSGPTIQKGRSLEV